MDKKALEVISREEKLDEQPAPGQQPAGQGAPAGAAPDASIAEAEGWAAVPQAFGGVLAMALPELRAVYTPAACMAWGEAMVPVAKKFGWSVAGVSPLLGLIAATVPLALPTIAAVRQRRAAGAVPAGEPSKVDAPAGGGPKKVEPVG